MGITLDDLKNVWFGFTNPDHWRNMMNEFGSVGPTISAAKDRMSNNLGLNSGGASPISGPPPTLGEVWQKLNNALTTPGKGATQPANNSGSYR